MPRHPARELISDGVIIDQSTEGMTEEEQLYSQFRDDAREQKQQPDVLIWKLPIDHRTGKPRSSDPGEFCTDSPMDAFPSFNALLSWIRDTYGSGFFRITGRMRSADGSEKTHFNRTVRIADIKPAATDEPKGRSEFSDLLAAIHAMNAQAQTNTENMLRAIATQQRFAGKTEELSAEKIMAWVTAGAALLSQMKGLFAPSQASPMGSLASTIQEFKAIQSMIEPGKPAGTETNDADVMNSLIKTFGPVVAHMLMKGAQQQAMTPPANVPPALPAPSPNPSPSLNSSPSPVQEPSAMTSPDLSQFKHNMVQLTAMAAKNADAEAVLSLIHI